MQNTDSDKAKEKIDFIIKKLIDFSNKNKYDLELYKSYVYHSSKSFNRYFSQIDNETDKYKIISDLKNDFHFQVDNVVSNILGNQDYFIENFEENNTYYLSKSETDKRIIGYSDNYRELIEMFLNEISLEQPEAVKPDEKYKTQNLFKVGMLFATGEMNKYFTINNLNAIVLNYGLSPLKIATELGNPSFEKNILASMNNYPTDNTNGNKNVFNSLDMMTKIIDHCKAEKLEIDTYFLSRLPIA